MSVRAAWPPVGVSIIMPYRSLISTNRPRGSSTFTEYSVSPSWMVMASMPVSWLRTEPSTAMGVIRAEAARMGSTTISARGAPSARLVVTPSNSGIWAIRSRRLLAVSSSTVRSGPWRVTSTLWEESIDIMSFADTSTLQLGMALDWSRISWTNSSSVRAASSRRVTLSEPLPPPISAPMPPPLPTLME